MPLREAAITLPPLAYGQPVRKLDPPIPVRAWIPRSRHGWTQVDGRATAYTATAAHVQYLDEHGRTGYAWVWAGAVTRIEAGR